MDMSLQAGWRSSPKAATLLPIAAVVAVGLAFGLYTLVVAGLPERWPVLLVVAAMAPCAAAIVGRHLRRLLLAVALLDVPLQIDTHFGFRDELARYGALGGWNVSI